MTILYSLATFTMVACKQKTNMTDLSINITKSEIIDIRLHNVGLEIFLCNAILVFESNHMIIITYVKIRNRSYRGHFAHMAPLVKLRFMSYFASRQAII